MNRQARYAGNLDLEDVSSEWWSFGKVTHVEAARRLLVGECHGTYRVETRCESRPDIIYPHRVEVGESVDVTPLRPKNPDGSEIE